MAKGFIYVARNESMPGLLKIGRTERIPDARMSELFSTGVPEPFQIVYYALTQDAKSDEAKVHQLLSRFRHRENREFFAVKIASAIGAITHLCEVEHDWKNEGLSAYMPDGTVGFGEHQSVDVSSRHGVESEENELADFVRALNVASLEAFVVSAFYDSNSCCCSIALASGIDEYSEAAAHIHAIAQDTLSQFEWFGAIGHGRRANEL
ncbi:MULTISPECIES: GIY-YIG nuclease family protein [unclassified Thioalkalivibrio]|uniref:GIY-YIG nuclease family protein n=1 Tax=unclassified Thioalkalivibrio TaxID=2621013 RepID=UPI0009DA0164|nr:MULTISPECIES: GIY-YIG nuclease family protein [unclassified Thioalkalivibrio]